MVWGFFFFVQVGAQMTRGRADKPPFSNTTKEEAIKIALGINSIDVA
jgi:hypothetical protein